MIPDNPKVAKIINRKKKIAAAIAASIIGVFGIGVPAFMIYKENKAFNSLPPEEKAKRYEKQIESLRKVLEGKMKTLETLRDSVTEQEDMLSGNADMTIKNVYVYKNILNMSYKQREELKEMTMVYEGMLTRALEKANTLIKNKPTGNDPETIRLYNDTIRVVQEHINLINYEVNGIIRLAKY